MPGGALLRTDLVTTRTEILTLDGALDVVFEPVRALGSGDGGPLSGASGPLVDATPDGALVLGGGDALRIAVPPGSTRTLAAVAPATYAGLAGGTVTVSSTFAGTAAVEVRSGGEVLTSAVADVGPGETAVALPAPPPPGRYTVALALTAPDGREALDDMRVLTLARLTRAAALKARRAFQRRSSNGDGEGGTFIDLRRCRRDGATAYSCQAVQVEWQRGVSDRRRCVGVWTVRLRPDGIRSSVREGPRACRAFGPFR